MANIQLLTTNYEEIAHGKGGYWEENNEGSVNNRTIVCGDVPSTEYPNGGNNYVSEIRFNITQRAYVKSITISTNLVTSYNRTSIANVQVFFSGTERYIPTEVHKNVSGKIHAYLINPPQSQSLSSIAEWQLDLDEALLEANTTYYIYLYVNNGSKGITGSYDTVTLTLDATDVPTVANVTLTSGIGISSVGGAGTHTIGESVSINASASTGYTFSNWTDSGNTVISTNNPYTFTMPAYDVSYTANASPNTYTITYNANDGSGSEESQDVTYDSSFTTMSNDAFTRSGYKIIKWNTQSDGRGDSYTPSSLYDWDKTNNITLYAQWKANTYEVTFNANGGRGEMEDETATYDSTFTIPDNGFTRPGYKITGWNTQSNGGGDSYGLNGKFSWKYTNNITLYAQWELQGLVHIYTDSGWRRAIPYIYTGAATNGGW